MAVNFLLLVCITSWKTESTLPKFASFEESDTESDTETLSSSLVVRPSSKDVPDEAFCEKGSVM